MKNQILLSIHKKQNVVKGDIIEISGKTTFIVEKIIDSGNTICVYNQSDVKF